MEIVINVIEVVFIYIGNIYIYNCDRQSACDNCDGICTHYQNLDSPITSTRVGGSCFCCRSIAMRHIKNVRNCHQMDMGESDLQAAEVET